MSARKYVPKATQRCGRCDRRGHNSRSRTCPARIADEAVARGLATFAAKLEGEAQTDGPGGAVEAALTKAAAAARAAADEVSR